MPYFRYPCILGELYFDVNLNLIAKPKQVKATITDATGEKKTQILAQLRDPRLFAQFVEKNMALTMEDVSKAISDDLFVVQLSNSIDDLQKIQNIAHNRIREWIGYVAPQMIQDIPDTTQLVESICQKDLGKTVKSLKSSMGVPQPGPSADALANLLFTSREIAKAMDRSKIELEHLSRQIIPNITVICGPALAARLLGLAGSLAKMARMPSSTIQLLGAETALFRHLKTGAKPPKHGSIHEHPLMAKAQKKDKGKVARDLAAKISMAAKVDYFKGAPIGEKLVKDLVKRYGSWG